VFGEECQIAETSSVVMEITSLSYCTVHPVGYAKVLGPTRTGTVDTGRGILNV
jgi:hypothetical protein